MSEVTPYRIENQRIKWGDWTVADGRYAANTDPITGSHLEKLVRAANSFDDLLATLHDITEYWNGSYNERAMTDALDHIIEVGKAAIAKAEAKP